MRAEPRLWLAAYPLICRPSFPRSPAASIADVHGLLGDVAMESDDFATALAELDAALGHLAAVVQVGGRGWGWQGRRGSGRLIAARA